MTTDTIKFMARYNAHANTEMGRVLAQLADEEWNRAMGGYYPSVRSLCSHLFICLRFTAARLRPWVVRLKGL
jgi:uncharacterized damage-inducible protein DinB